MPFGPAASVAKANHGTYWRRQELRTRTKAFVRLCTPRCGFVPLCTPLYAFLRLCTTSVKLKQGTYLPHRVLMKATKTGWQRLFRHYYGGGYVDGAPPL